jgi:ABC-type amino acid transport substrate-binding protein
VIRRSLAATGALLLAAALSSAAPVSVPPSPDRELVVGVYEAPPWAMKGQDGEWSGLTVDLWKALAADLKLPYRFVEGSLSGVLEAVSRGRMDVAAGPFAATIEREQLLDFTHTYVVSGVGIAIRRQGDQDRWLSVVEALSKPTALWLYAGVAVLLFLAGATLWLLERRHNAMFGGSTAQGLGSGFWWAGVTTVGVGYGDKVPITFWGRLMALLWMFISLILVTSLTAFVAARLAVAELGEVRGVTNLRNAVSAGIEGSVSTDFLRREKLPHRLYATAPKAIEALLAGDVKAVVYNGPVLRYYAEHDPGKRIEVLPGILEAMPYAFPVPDGSPLRGPLNTALRREMAESHWRDLKDKYLGAESAGGP